jgi:glycyl-tRNA synthetase (class II)
MILIYIQFEHFIYVGREFTMAEIEHFCDPMEKNHPKFESVQDTEMLFFSAANQMDGKSAELHSIGQAVDKVKPKLTSKSWEKCIQLLKC